MKKHAFTMIELIFVIVVIGIITAVMLPRIDRDNVYEAAQQLESHLKYAQHLSMVDNAYNDASATWYRNRWGIAFDNDQNRYKVKHSTNGGGVWANAVDPSSGLELNDNAGGSTDLNDKFAITSVTSSCGAFANGRSIYFDNLGRPYFYLDAAAHTAAGTPQAGLMTNNCTLVVTTSSNTATITIEKETGYISITAFN